MARKSGTVAVSAAVPAGHGVLVKPFFPFAAGLTNGIQKASYWEGQRPWGRSVSGVARYRAGRRSHRLVWAVVRIWLPQFGTLKPVIDPALRRSQQSGVWLDHIVADVSAFPQGSLKQASVPEDRQVLQNRNRAVALTCDGERL